MYRVYIFQSRNCDTQEDTGNDPSHEESAEEIDDSHASDEDVTDASLYLIPAIICVVVLLCVLAIIVFVLHKVSSRCDPTVQPAHSHRNNNISMIVHVFIVNTCMCMMMHIGTCLQVRVNV